MPRIRTIKPDFFLHEEVAALPPLHRLLFVGLWTLADKRGVLEDKPRRIKAALFPWDDCDVDAMLWDLTEARLILRYDARKGDGDPVEAIAIPGFKKHQRPHPKETPADLSEPDLKTASREKKRQAKPNSPSIPSSPAGKESEERKESWEGKEPPKSGVATDGQRAMGSIPAPPGMSKALGVVVNANDTLEDKMRRLWKERRGNTPTHGWWNEGAVRLAWGMADGSETELLRVYSAGLDAPFPLLTKLADLPRHFDVYAATKLPEGRPKAGRASDADKDWSGFAPSQDSDEIFEGTG